MVFGNLPLLSLVKACRVTVALALIGMIFAGQALARESQPLDRVVAIVGAQNISDKELEPMIITQSEVDSMARPLLAQLARKGGGVDEQKVRKKVLDEIIMRRLRLQEAERLKIKISDQEVKALFDQMAKQNNLSPDQFSQALQQQGMDLEHYREDLRDQIIQSRLLAKVIRPMINVSDEEIKEVYQATGGKSRSEEIHLGQILLTIEPGSKPEKVQAVRDLAQRLIRELKGGANLASLASQYSDDSSGLKGGDLGWFKRGQLQPEIEKQIFNLPPGSVAGPIPTSQGLHILQVMERRNASSPETMQQVKVRHILITVPRKALPEEEEQALQKIEKIRQEIEKGLSFEEGAKKYSQDSSNKEGGDLGWVGRGLMVPEFEQVIFSLEPGVLSKPVRTAFGWHLIKVEKRRTQDASSLSAMRNELEKRVLDAKSQIKFRQWLRDLRLRAFVELR